MLKVVIKKVGQANWVEVCEDDKVRIVFDMGMPIDEKVDNVTTYLNNANYCKDKPIFILSHWHMDHYHALLALLPDLQNYFSQMYVPTLPPVSKTVKNLYNIIKQNFPACDIQLTKGKNEMALEKVDLPCEASLYKSEIMFSENYRSLGLIIKSASNYCVLTGDMSYKQIQKMLTTHNLPNDGYLVVPHHGGNAGKYVLQNQFKKGIISVGKSNKYGHPKCDIIKTLLKNCENVQRTVFNDVTINL